MRLRYSRDSERLVPFVPSPGYRVRDGLVQPMVYRRGTPMVGRFFRKRRKYETRVISRRLSLVILGAANRKNIVAKPISHHLTASE
jgi:hypothetical protein